jgi:hypothetical protein
MVGRLELRDDFKKQAEWDFHLKKKFQRSTSLLLAGSKGPRVSNPSVNQP